MGNSHSAVRQLLWTHGVAAHSFMFLEDSGKFMLEFLYTYVHVCERALCTLIPTHTHTHKLMLGGVGMPQHNVSP